MVFTVIYRGLGFGVVIGDLIACSGLVSIYRFMIPMRKR